MKDNRLQEYLAELKRHRWKIVPGKGNHNCTHPVEEYLTCGEDKGRLTRIIPQGKINHPEDYAKDIEFWICPKHLPFYQIDSD